MSTGVNFSFFFLQAAGLAELGEGKAVPSKANRRGNNTPQQRVSPCLAAQQKGQEAQQGQGRSKRRASTQAPDEKQGTGPHEPEVPLRGQGSGKAQAADPVPGDAQMHGAAGQGSSRRRASVAAPGAEELVPATRHNKARQSLPRTASAQEQSDVSTDMQEHMSLGSPAVDGKL